MNKKKFILVFFIIIIIMTIIIISYDSFYRFNMPIIEDDLLFKNKSYELYSNSEKKLLNFIKEEMISDYGGIYTNYLNDKEINNILENGRSILSESIGLIMYYYYQESNKEFFDIYVSYINKYLLTEEGIIYWEINENDYSNNSSATIDDLRILRTLIFAYNKWEDSKYLLLYNDMVKALYYKHTNNGYLVNGYNIKYKEKFNEINISYIDLYTLSLIARNNSKFNRIYDNSYKILKDAYVSDGFPFYYKYYDFLNKKYSSENNISMIDSLLVVLHLSEIGMNKPETIEWLDQKLLKGKNIYSEYNIKTKLPTSNIESTAIYAIIARIYKNRNQPEMYKLAIEKMLKFQIKNKESVFYGGFADEKKEEAYSFDNLQALLAL